MPAYGLTLEMSQPYNDLIRILTALQWGCEIPTRPPGLAGDGEGRAAETGRNKEKDLKSCDFRSFLVEISGIEPLTS